MITARDQT